ncbi:MAG: NAD(P)H-dependent oxidoreductase subunit E [Candidatus Aminicenantes bacterium]|nr:NAD(P)H-dependent oxidoreductase subunit E [Candidatus Aminicenantes bacterium]MDH5706307.1 NAD(P)H-dependent oxidoreductase subunit E [Candidatus Aminicenantes bacterium]
MKDEKLVEIIQAHRGEQGALLNLLLEVQDKYNYLPKEVLKQISEEMDIPFSRLFSIATFFKSFSLTPRGKHSVHVCMGTACQVWGGQRLVDKVGEELKIKPGETTEDLNFTLETINCPGTCGLAPVVVLDKEVHGKVSQKKLMKLIKETEK